jgi:hypothetical protein
MKNKTTFPPTFFYSSLLIIVFVASSLMQTGCDNAGGQTTQQKGSDKWITMNITFQPNTDGALREKAIKDIANMWTKEAAAFRKQDPSLYPSICVTEFDTLKYQLSLLQTHFSISTSGEPKPLSTARTTIPCPPCPGLCIQCDSTKNRLMLSYGITKMVFEEIK